MALGKQLLDRIVGGLWNESNLGSVATRHMPLNHAKVERLALCHEPEPEDVCVARSSHQWESGCSGCEPLHTCIGLVGHDGHILAVDFYRLLYDVRVLSPAHVLYARAETDKPQLEKLQAFR